MSDSYILHDVMRKVKADGLFDSIRRDLISDTEQKVFVLMLDDLVFFQENLFPLAIVFRFKISN